MAKPITRNIAELFTYDPATGELFWKDPQTSTAIRQTRESKGAGFLTSHGYRRVEVHGVSYLVHHIVFFLHHGYIPQFIDHRNGIRSDNRIENLREATSRQNSRNRSKRSGTSSRFKGVSWHKSKNRWQVQIQVDKQAMLGYFSSEIDAARAYNEAARAYFGEFAKLNDLEEIQSTKNTDDLSK